LAAWVLNDGSSSQLVTRELIDCLTSQGLKSIVVPTGPTQSHSIGHSREPIIPNYQSLRQVGRAD